MNAFPQLAISDPADLRFGISPKPLTTRRGLTLGGGVVYFLGLGLKETLRFTQHAAAFTELVPDARIYQKI